MLPTIGHVAIVVGLALTLYAAVAFGLAARRGDRRLRRAAGRRCSAPSAWRRWRARRSWRSLLGHDFSIAYVARNNATTTPPFYSVISLWAALEGSILFWALLLTGWSALVLHRYRDRHVGAHAVGRGDPGAGQRFFFAVMTWPGNPFARMTPVPDQGNGPNALLQNNPFMGLHPPLLYLGLYRPGGPVRVRVAALDDGAHRSGMARHRAALDRHPVDLPHRRHRGRGVVELRGARLGRLLGVGPGRERRAHAVAHGDRLHPLQHGRRAAGRAAGSSRWCSSSRPSCSPCSGRS